MRPTRGGLLLTHARTYAVASPIAFHYGEGAGLGRRTAVVRTSGFGEEDTIFTAIDGLTPGTAYSVRAVAFDGSYDSAPSPTATFSTVTLTAPARTPGPAGSAGSVVTRAALLIALANNKLTATARKTVKVTYVATAGGTAAPEVRKDSKRIGPHRRHHQGRPEHGQLERQVGVEAAAAGKYALTLLVTTGDGQTANGKGTPTTKKAKKK